MSEKNATTPRRRIVRPEAKKSRAAKLDGRTREARVKAEARVQKKAVPRRTRKPAVVAAPKVRTTRKPRNYLKKLSRLGYSREQIEAMDKIQMKRTLKDGVAASVNPEMGNGHSGLTIYVDCQPEKGDEAKIVRLEEFILPFQLESSKEGGTALLVAKVLENPPKGAIVADSRYPSSAAVLEVLVPMADRVFRALH